LRVRVAHDRDQQVEHQDDDEEGEEQEHRDRRPLRVVTDLEAAQRGECDGQKRRKEACNAVKVAEHRVGLWLK
jgi:hypothetical protein